MVSRVAKAVKDAEQQDEGDDESNAIVYQGATIRQLSIMFHGDPKVVARKVSGLVPCGRRRNTAIYRIDEAAARLVKPGYEIERYIMEMNHLDLPPLLSKEFWNSQRARLAFEESNGDLWRTADVVRAISECFMVLRMAILKLQDGVERQTTLSDVQRTTIRAFMDGALKDVREKLQERFKDYAASDHPVERSGDDGYWELDGPVTEDADARGDGLSGGPQVEDQYHGL